MEIMYGLRVEDENDQYVQINEKGVRAFSEVITPGRWLVEILPILVYLPAWFPGANFKRKAAQWKEDVAAMRNVPWFASVYAMVSRPEFFRQ